MRRKRNRRNLDIKDISNRRLKVIFVVIILFFFLINIRLFTIQVLGHEKYKSMALNQYWNSHELSARRGDILSSDGFLLAGTQINYLMYFEPNRVFNKFEAAQEIAEVLANIKYERQQHELSILENTSFGEKSESETYEEDEENGEVDPTITENEEPKTLEEIKKELFDKYLELLNKDLMWIAAEHYLNPLEKETIEENEFYGVGFEEEPIRYYPEETLLSHVLGFVASNDIGEKVGYYGIEGAFNEDLKGKSGRVLEEKDALGTPILMGEYEKVESIQGRDVVLTINKSIQYMAEKKIKDGVETYDAVSGTVLIMDPSTGGIIAMANYPTYSSERFYEESVYLKSSPHRKSIELRNISISDIYEPGSVFKPLTVSAAIDLGIVSPETTYYDNGPVYYSTHEVDNWDKKHHGQMTIIQLLQKSNNIGAAWVGTNVGARNLHKYFSDFGVGSKSGISLEGEETGKLNEYEEWRDIGTANISFGQGVSVNSLQMLNAFNVFANGGYLLQPRIVSKIIDEDRVIPIPTKTVKQVIKKDTADTMVMMLEKAAEGGEASYFVLKNYRIAGKTGTAQIPESGGYAEDRTNATFVGFDAKEKNFSMLVKLEEPRAKVYASETAVPIWMDIFSELVKFYGIPPDKES